MKSILSNQHVYINYGNTHQLYCVQLALEQHEFELQVHWYADCFPYIRGGCNAPGLHVCRLSHGGGGPTTCTAPHHFVHRTRASSDLLWEPVPHGCRGKTTVRFSGTQSVSVVNLAQGVGALIPCIVQWSTAPVFLLHPTFSEFRSKKQSKCIKLVTGHNWQRGSAGISKQRVRVRWLREGTLRVRTQSTLGSVFANSEILHWWGINRIIKKYAGHNFRYPAYILYTRNLRLNHFLDISERGLFRSYSIAWLADYR